MSGFYTTFKLKDGAMDMIVKHLIRKYALNEARCIYKGGLKTKLQNVGTQFQLYVVAHGSDSEPLMCQGSGSGTLTSRWEMLRPVQLAQEIFDAFPDGAQVRVKLGMCFGSKDFKVKVNRRGEGEVQIVSSFASLTTQFLKRICEMKTREGQGKDLSGVVIGGFNGPAIWNQSKNPFRPNEPKIPPTLGKKVSDKTGDLVWVYGQPVGQNRDYFKPDYQGGKAAVPRPQLPDNSRRQAAHSPVYCYFPFDYELREPKTHRGVRAAFRDRNRGEMGQAINHQNNSFADEFDDWANTKFGVQDGYEV